VKKKTVGELVSQNAQNNKNNDSINVMDLQKSMQEDYMNELLAIVDKDHSLYPGDFYVVVLTKAERILTNTFRNYFFSRSSCPTPFYDQTVWRYNKRVGRVEYLWTVPGKDECVYILQNKSELPPSHQQLLKFVIMFFKGVLLDMAKKFNKETQEQGVLYKISEG